jgi:hypothetical protein
MPSFTLIGIETDRSRPEARPRVPKNAPHGEFLGDQRVFTDQLREVNKKDQPKGPVVGHHSGFCSLVNKGPGNKRFYQCFATFDLADGLLTARTMLDLNSNAPVTATITGGTGNYAGANGQITVTFPEENTSLFKIDIT